MFERLAGVRLRQRRFADALAVSYLAVDLGPWRESAHRLVIDIRLAERNIAEAVRHYERYAAQLAADLGAAPSARLAVTLAIVPGRMTHRGRPAPASSGGAGQQLTRVPVGDRTIHATTGSGAEPGVSPPRLHRSFTGPAQGPGVLGGDGGTANRPGDHPEGATVHTRTSTARVTSAWYLGLAITGIAGFLLVRPALYVDGDPAATLQNLATRQGLARFSVVLEMGIVVTQALAAVWFYKLLRPLRPVAGVAVAAFGLVNAVAIMASAVFLATAAAVAGDQSLLAGGDPAAAVGLLHQLSTHAWGIGALFFGLWLIPMGWAAVTTGRFPAPLGRSSPQRSACLAVYLGFRAVRGWVLTTRPLGGG